MKPKIAVIGAGVVGLSTAINIETIIPGCDITIIADRFEADTTSIGAGGIFRPTEKAIPGVPADTIRRWSQDSWDFFSKLALSDLGSTTGHTVMPGYIFSQEKIENPIYEDIIFSCRELSQKELAKLNMSQYRHGYQLTSIIVQMSKYLPWLMEKFVRNGGKILKRKVNDLKEFQGGPYDVVVNCTGLGSQELVNDKIIHPVRGQLIRLEAPWINFWIYTDHGAYVLPNAEYVAIGGVRQEGRSDLAVDAEDRKGILERCYDMWPPLKGGKIIGEWVGLRPTRKPLRLEKESIRLPGGILKVVHNYGHGAHGITLSWGTGKEAARLVKEMIYGSVHAKL
ncbi:D-aspartate oxidase-like [Pecten maximus]|uniref:D-aspartate oxidase-like n=1 Tax=Pecten maximus TaxID=6579 RepID=UPI0014582932|nr:D-aspartate oxidase-like [Pecten maximus]XP_033753949.1 D-aspartate oxidase-like [Pecten maximus]